MGRSKVISFRLRAGRDSDILIVLDAIPKSIDRSDIIRGALRAFFYPSNTDIPLLPPKPRTPTVAGLQIRDKDLKEST